MRFRMLKGSIPAFLIYLLTAVLSPQVANMPPMHVAQRPRFFNMCITGSTPQHGHVLEYIMSITNILVQVAFTYGSYLFLSSEETDLKVGDTLFIIGSVITFVFALYNLIESRTHWMNYSNAEREDRIEFWESSCFFFAGLVFLVGSLFFWPGIYSWWYAGEDETLINDYEESGESHGAKCFITGSVLFLIASMFNGIGLGMNKDEAEKNGISVMTHYLHIIALACSQEGDAVALHACQSTGEFGTYLYIYGSLLYLAEALLNFTNSALKHKYANDGKVGHKTQPESDVEEELMNDS